MYCTHFLRHIVLLFQPPCVCPYSDLRKLYIKAGVENKPTVFLFNDTQVVDESFLEDINNILSSGEVPNLYSKAEDFEEVKNGLNRHSLAVPILLSSGVGVHSLA